MSTLLAVTTIMACADQREAPTAPQAADLAVAPAFSITQGSTNTARTGSGSNHKATSITVQAPAAASADMLIAHIAVKSLASTDVICAPAGWTSVRRHNRSSNVSQEIFRYSPSSSQVATSYTWTFRKNTASCGTASNTVELAALGAVTVFTGASTVGDSSAGTNGSTGTASAPSVPVAAGARVLRFYAIDKGADIAVSNFLYRHKETTEERSIAGHSAEHATAGSSGAMSATFTPANWVATTISINAAPTTQAQTLTFGTLPDRVWGDASFTLSATASSGLPVAYSLGEGSTGCSLGGTNNSTVTITGATGAGMLCIIVANQPGNGSFLAAPPVERSFAIARAGTSMGSITASSSTHGGTTTLSATVSPAGVAGGVVFYLNGSSTPIPASYDVATGVATVTNVPHGLDAGATGYSVRAVFTSVSGNYDGSESTNEAGLSIGATEQTLTFEALGGRTYGDAAFTVAASSTSGLVVTFTSLTPTKCSVSGTTITILEAGTCTIRASQSGSANYSAAADVERSFEIAKATATLALSGLSHTWDGTAKTATATVTPAGAGSVTVTYDGSGTAPSLPGPHAVVASLSSTNYDAEPATGTLLILNPVPAITAIQAPQTAAIRATDGTGSFTLTLAGSGFSPGSRVRWTMGTSSTDLNVLPSLNGGSVSFTVQKSLVATPGVAYIQVTNPAVSGQGGGTSTMLPLFITDETTTTTNNAIGSISAGSGTITTGQLTITGTGSGVISAATYQSQPGGTTGAFAAGAKFLDVHALQPANQFTSLTLVFCGVPAGAGIFWWSGSAWAQASSQTPNSPSTGCTTVNINGSTTPSLSNLTGDYFAIGTLATTTTLSLTGAPVQHSDRITLGATVSAAASAASSGTVKFVLDGVTVAEKPVTLSGTPTSGTVTAFSHVVGLQPGSYNLRAEFVPAAASPYAGSQSSSQTLTVVKESASLTYTGDEFARTASSSITSAAIRLAVQVEQDDDGDAADITKATVRFTVKRGNGSTLSTHTASVNASGQAAVTVNIAGSDDPYSVIYEIDPANAWFASSYGTEILTVEVNNSDQRVTGGGWIADPLSRNGRGNFGFTVQPQKNGSLKGNAVYVYRDAEFDYIVKTNSWQGGSLLFNINGDAARASFSGRANFQKVDRATGVVVQSAGNYTFVVDIFDGDLLNPRQSDSFALTILDSSGSVWRQIGTRGSQVRLGGGNVTVHTGAGQPRQR